MTDKNTFFGIALFAAVGIAIITAFFTYQTKSESTRVTNLPDAFMEEVVAMVFDKQGKPKMKIASPKMVHYSKNDTTYLTTPQLTLYRKSPQPWYVSSKHAEAIDGDDHVNFKDDVIVQHAADQHQPATVIKTTTLTVHTKTQIAETNDHITLVQPNITIKGTGMHADIDNGDIKLLSQARGEYVPNS